MRGLSYANDRKRRVLEKTKPCRGEKWQPSGAWEVRTVNSKRSNKRKEKSGECAYQAQMDGERSQE